MAALNSTPAICLGRRTVVASVTSAVFALPLCLSGCKPSSRRAGVAVVGASPTGVPFSFVDPWTNLLTGAMIDTVRSVAGQAGIGIELESIPFSALIPALLVRKIDVIAAAMLRTPQREQVAAFSKPVYAYGGGLVVAATDLGVYLDLRSLRARRVGAQLGTRFVDQLHDADIDQVNTYENLSDVLRDLEHGRIDAAYGDAPILAYQLRIGARPHLRMVTTFRSPAEEALCFVFRRDDPLLARFDAAIETLHDTSIPAIARRWQLT